MRYNKYTTIHTKSTNKKQVKSAEDKAFTDLILHLRRHERRLNDDERAIISKIMVDEVWLVMKDKLHWNVHSDILRPYYTKTRIGFRLKDEKAIFVFCQNFGIKAFTPDGLQMYLNDHNGKIQFKHSSVSKEYVPVTGSSEDLESASEEGLIKQYRTKSGKPRVKGKKARGGYYAPLLTPGEKQKLPPTLVSSWRGKKQLQIGEMTTVKKPIGYAWVPVKNKTWEEGKREEIENYKPAKKEKNTHGLKWGDLLTDDKGMPLKETKVLRYANERYEARLRDAREQIKRKIGEWLDENPKIKQESYHDYVMGLPSGEHMPTREEFKEMLKETYWQQDYRRDVEAKLKANKNELIDYIKNTGGKGRLGGRQKDTKNKRFFSTHIGFKRIILYDTVTKEWFRHDKDMPGKHFIEPTVTKVLAREVEGYDRKIKTNKHWTDHWTNTALDEKFLLNSKSYQRKHPKGLSNEEVTIYRGKNKSQRRAPTRMVCDYYRLLFYVQI